MTDAYSRAIGELVGRIERGAACVFCGRARMPRTDVCTRCYRLQHGNWLQRLWFRLVARALGGKSE